jgi:anaerobic magnesium-protoporphyrin IX monomethyl ester cyclase
MRVLALYPNIAGYNQIPIGLSMIITILSKAGHIVKLFDTTFMVSINSDTAIREKAQLVKPTNTDYLYENLTEKQIILAFKQTMQEFNPDTLLVTIVEDNYRFAHKLLKEAKNINLCLSTLVGGSTPSVAPEVIIENPYIDFVIQGEGEDATLEFCNGSVAIENIKNLWYKKDNKIYHNTLRPFIDMNALPFVDLSFWDKRHFIKAYNGKIYKTNYVESSRGCPHTCTYCINHAIREKFKDCGIYFRRKNFKLVISEVAQQKETYGFERIVFNDDNFLLCTDNQLKQFAELWKEYINLPYWINTSAEYINNTKLTYLKDSNCDGIGLGVETGNEWVRKNILLRSVTNKKLKEVFDLIHTFNIRTTANFMIGFPNEYEFDIFESIKLMKILKPKSFGINFVCPYIGTKLHKLCQKLNLLDAEISPGFRGMAHSVSIRKPTMYNPNISKKRLAQLYLDSMEYVKGTRPIPKKYLIDSPGVNSPRGIYNSNEAKIISQLGEYCD